MTCTIVLSFRWLLKVFFHFLPGFYWLLRSVARFFFTFYQVFIGFINRLPDFFTFYQVFIGSFDLLPDLAFTALPTLEAVGIEMQFFLINLSATIWEISWEIQSGSSPSLLALSSHTSPDRPLLPLSGPISSVVADEWQKNEGKVCFRLTSRKGWGSTRTLPSCFGGLKKYDWKF